MATFTRPEPADLARFVRSYGIQKYEQFQSIPAGSVNSNFSFVAGDEKAFLRVYEEQDHAGAVREAALLRTLAARGVRIVAPRLATDGTPVGTLGGKPAAIFRWVEGTMACQRAVSTGRARAVGKALARVHAAGAGIEVGGGRFRPSDLRGRLSRIGADPRFAGEAVGLRAALARWEVRRDDSLPRGLIHGDLFRDNVLWRGEQSEEIVALLDFESASEGVWAYDLMVTVLAWCFGDRLDAALARALVAGYASVRPLEPAEGAGLLAEGCLAALRFTITRITDYAMRGEADGPRVMKDWRRFRARFEALEALGDGGLAALLAAG